MCFWNCRHMDFIFCTIHSHQVSHWYQRRDQGEHFTMNGERAISALQRIYTVYHRRFLDSLSCVYMAIMRFPFAQCLSSCILSLCVLSLITFYIVEVFFYFFWHIDAQYIINCEKSQKNCMKRRPKLTCLPFNKRDVWLAGWLIHCVAGCRQMAPFHSRVTKRKSHIL